MQRHGSTFKRTLVAEPISSCLAYPLVELLLWPVCLYEACSQLYTNAHAAGLARFTCSAYLVCNWGNRPSRHTSRYVHSRAIAGISDDLGAEYLVYLLDLKNQIKDAVHPPRYLSPYTCSPIERFRLKWRYTRYFSRNS